MTGVGVGYGANVDAGVFAPYRARRRDRPKWRLLREPVEANARTVMESAVRTEEGDRRPESGESVKTVGARYNQLLQAFDSPANVTGSVTQRITTSSKVWILPSRLKTIKSVSRNVGSQRRASETFPDFPHLTLVIFGHFSLVALRYSYDSLEPISTGFAREYPSHAFGRRSVGLGQLRPLLKAEREASDRRHRSDNVQPSPFTRVMACPSSFSRVSP